MQIDHVDHLVLTVQNIQTTCEFYSRVLGMQVITFEEGRKALRSSEKRLNLALRFQQLAQAKTISELHGNFAALEGVLGKKSSAQYFKTWLDESAISPFSQGKKTMHKQTIASQMSLPRFGASAASSVL